VNRGPTADVRQVAQELVTRPAHIAGLIPRGDLPAVKLFTNVESVAQRAVELEEFNARAYDDPGTCKEAPKTPC
jgi:hypothetical protein